jgi:hypothetical protein
VIERHEKKGRWNIPGFFNERQEAAISARGLSRKDRNRNGIEGQDPAQCGAC